MTNWKKFVAAGALVVLGVATGNMMYVAQGVATATSNSAVHAEIEGGN